MRNIKRNWWKIDEKYDDETGGVVTLIGCLKSLAHKYDEKY